MSLLTSNVRLYILAKSKEKGREEEREEEREEGRKRGREEGEGGKFGTEKEC